MSPGQAGLDSKGHRLPTPSALALQDPGVLGPPMLKAVPPLVDSPCQAVTSVSQALGVRVPPGSGPCWKAPLPDVCSDPPLERAPSTERQRPPIRAGPFLVSSLPSQCGRPCLAPGEWPSFLTTHHYLLTSLSLGTAWGLPEA